MKEASVFDEKSATSRLLRRSEKFTIDPQTEIDGGLDVEVPGYSIDVPEFYIHLVEQGIGSTRNEEVYTSDRRYLKEITAQKAHPARFRDKSTLNPLVRLRGSVAALAVDDMDSYYHFWVEFMARFHLLRLSGIEPDYYVFPTHYAFNRECIELLEIPLEKIIPASNGSTIQADLLLVPSLINNWEFVDFDGYPHFQKQWLPSWLRNFYPQFKSAGCRKNRTRIYISRGDARYRRVANEEDVIDVLRSFGFVVCTPEKLSLPDQIEAFGAAEIVVAPHGAGLTNISFCPIDAVVLEFFSKHYLDSSYRLQSSVLGHRYYFMVDTETRLQSTAPLERDMVVNLTRLRRWLRLLGL